VDADFLMKPLTSNFASIVLGEFFRDDYISKETDRRLK
jgi:hypothetical protein